MRYLPDTNSCIRFINGRSPALRRAFLRVAPIDIALCAVVKAEMYTGSAKSKTPEVSRAKQERFFGRFVSLPFDDAAADVYGRIRAHLEVRGQPIGANDLLIASIALVHGLIVVTHNVREFSRVPDLIVEDWESADSA